MAEGRVGDTGGQEKGDSRYSHLPAVCFYEYSCQLSALRPRI